VKQVNNYNQQQTSHAQSHRGAVRTINEDAFLDLPQHGIWVVADGMGGHSAGDVASQLVIDAIESVIETVSPDKMSCEILIQALKSANESLLNLSKSQLDGKVAGSTVVILFIKDNRFYMLWAGDSRGYLLRDNELIQFTRDHSQVNEMVDEGLISQDEAETHPLANVITRAVGVDNVNRHFPFTLFGQHNLTAVQAWHQNGWDQLFEDSVLEVLEDEFDIEKWFNNLSKQVEFNDITNIHITNIESSDSIKKGWVIKGEDSPNLMHLMHQQYTQQFNEYSIWWTA